VRRFTNYEIVILKSEIVNQINTSPLSHLPSVQARLDKRGDITAPRNAGRVNDFYLYIQICICANLYI